MDRTDFYNITDIGNGPEYDHLYNNISKFAPQYPVNYYRIVEADVMRPDMISYKCYNTVDLWWLLMVYNNIENPLMNIVPGNLLMVPNIVDVYNFYKQFTLH